ncbi:signal peptide peptidase SppA [bacterium]|nr:signal peptide peptidase SppA [bacterium]
MKSRTLLIGFGIGGFVILLFLVSIFFAKFLLGEKKSFGIGDEIGVLEVEGMIVDSQEFIKQLHDFRDNERIKAIVLRIDSPGGVVGPSQEMYEEVKKFALQKKVVVSMGSLAASGGYYIAAPATMIFANPGTVTGSIGVLMKLSNIQGLLGKIGMNSFVLKSGKFKDSGSPVRPMTREDKEIMQGVIDSMHGQFVKAVAEGRKIPVDEVKKIADGRIFSGEQALKIKLVDRLGNLQDAIAETAKMVGIKGEPKLVYPPEKKRTLLDFLVESTSDRIANKLRSETGISARYEMAD